MFLKPKAASFGQSQSLSDSDGWLVRAVTPKGGTGAVVNQSTVMGLSSVFACVRLLSDTLAGLPIDIVQNNKDGSRTPVHDHPLGFILNQQANDYTTAMTFRNALQHHALLWGTGYFEIERKRSGELVNLWPMLPDRTRFEWNDGVPQFQTTVDGQFYNIPFANGAHLPGVNFDTYSGYSLLQVASSAMGLGIALETFASKFFGNDAKSGGFLSHPGKLGDQAVNNLRNSVNKDAGLEAAHRIRILEEGMKFTQTTIAPEDSQFLQSRDFQIADVARFFGVPLSLLQSMEKSTTWGSGLEELNQAFLSYSCQPWVIRFEQMANHKLLTPEETAKGLRVKLNLRALMRPNASARKDYYASGIQSGWLTRNEARALEDMNPLEGLDEPLQPLNMAKGSATAAAEDNASLTNEPNPAADPTGGM